MNRHKNTFEEAIEQIIDYLQDERHDFIANPSSDHIYNAIATLQAWLTNQNPAS